MYKQVSENDTIDEVSAWLRAVTLTIIIVSQAHERKIRHQYKWAVCFWKIAEIHTISKSTGFNNGI